MAISPSQPKSRPIIVFTVSGVIVLLVSGLWLARSSRNPTAPVSLILLMNPPTADRFTFSTDRPPDSFFTAVLTNNSSISVRVLPPLVQLEDRDGRVINHGGYIWTVKGGEEHFLTWRPVAIAGFLPKATRKSKGCGLLPRFLTMPVPSRDLSVTSRESCH